MIRTRWNECSAELGSQSEGIVSVGLDYATLPLCSGSCRQKQDDDWSQLHADLALAGR